MEYEQIIKAVIATLDTIPITGRANMDKFVGCLNALESLLKKENTDGRQNN